MSGTVAMRAASVRAAVWAATVVVLPCWAIAAATGGLYLLYHHHLLGAGIAVPGSLPLEGLAGHAAQPLLRAVAAWLCAGAAAGCLLGAIHRPRPGLGLAAFAAGAAVVVVLSGAAGRALRSTSPWARSWFPSWAARPPRSPGACWCAAPARRRWEWERWPLGQRSDRLERAHVDGHVAVGHGRLVGQPAVPALGVEAVAHAEVGVDVAPVRERPPRASGAPCG